MLDDLHRKKFLEVLAETDNISFSAKAISYTPEHVRVLIKENPEFAAQVEEAQEQAIDKLLLEARRRAHDGTKKPVFWQGWQTGYILEYSDSLLMFLIKGKREEFRDKVKFSGDKENPIEVKGTIALVDFDPNDPESIRRAHEAVFGAPEALTVIKGGSRA
jgi:hypothetical protein